MAGLGVDRQVAAERLDTVAQPIELRFRACRGHRGAGLVLDDLEDERSLLFSHRDGQPRPGVGVLEQLENAEVHRYRDLGWTRGTRCGFDANRDGSACCHRAEQRTKTACLEYRRVDPLRKLRRLVQRLLHAALHFFEERIRSRRIGREQLRGELQVHGEGDEVLLYALVQIALDRTAVGVGSQYEPLPRRAQLRDVVAQLVERFAQRLDVPSLQRGSTSWVVALQK